jgi:hypothetical protein
MSIYFPYIRARQYDVIAVSNAAATMAATGKVIPLLEPVNAASKTLRLRSSTFAAEDLPVGLIMNPKVGALVGQASATKALLSDMRKAGATVTPALIVDYATHPNDLKALQQHVLPGETPLFVHYGVPASPPVGSSIQGITNATHILIEGMASGAHEKTFSPRGRVRDGFKIQPNNVSYPPRSTFSDLHLTYKNLGFNAFGDFTTVGHAHREGGGLPKAVVIHMTESMPTEIVCHHFKSTSNATTANTAGKFGEAAAKVRAYSNKNPGKLDFSDACQELLAIEAQGHFPGLASLKRLSVQHHLELMSTLV